MSIAAMRSFPETGLEGSNPSFSMVNEGYCVRSIEVDGFSKSILGHVWGLTLDLQAETLPESICFNTASAHIGFEG